MQYRLFWKPNYFFVVFLFVFESTAEESYIEEKMLYISTLMHMILTKVKHFHIEYTFINLQLTIDGEELNGQH